ncbi:site-specific recombinase XerD [Sphaerochaeta pleomorpha str. Grapes]|uniref:Site-specific recombinase XerD n=1 Tax=Sphaerochaeta pleomorpha (strain ATCC BAA-1885 / DSM 22778 / Grapes) TaxID=158190 RepID=G8QS68_SPHPG|nr:tyrosine-type recombinase/integrase [Sphaerochaeta pleomorpha]AEV28929.1 site-specific recombinase XerD [Sphaerochaeta pleomorpha str. Grapes]AEV29458.1 site-specific recombinase XerD [Sphaerochaeta pleomorpha str. Grapes]
MEQLSAVLKVLQDYDQTRYLNKATLRLYELCYLRVEKELQQPLEEGMGLLEAVRYQANELIRQGKTSIIAYPTYSRMLCYLETGTIHDEYLRYNVTKTVLIQDTFKPVLKQYLAYLQSEGKSVFTIDSYRNVATQFLNHLGANDIHNIAEINGSLVISFFEVLRGTWVSTNIRVAASAMRKFFWYLGYEGAIFQAIPTNCPRHTPIIPMLEIEEDAAISSYICNGNGSWKDRTILSLTYYLGVRANDIINLKLENIDWIKGTLSLVQSKTRNLLVLPLLPVIGNCMQKYLLEERPRSNIRYVFLSYREPYHKLGGHSAIYAIIRRVFAELGIRDSKRKGSHLLRHHAASKQLQNWVPLGTISNMLGHKDMDSTTIYTTVEYEKIRPCCLAPYYKGATV